ncbi:MAG: cytochrome c maturation protein CcmE [Acidimicrobiia bacterium]|nr:cytochrome c maturation protein CcmE [Acidimicrobiia bacterium]
MTSEATRRPGRATFLILSVVAALALLGVLFSQLLADNAVLYLEPREALDQRAELPDGEEFRLGGWIVPGSVVTEGDDLRFEVTDFAETITVETSATPPQLFGEDIPVLLDGTFSDGTFVASTIILRHEEEYIPEGEASG